MRYRPVPDAHEEAYDRILSYAFAPERGPDPDREGPDRPAGFHRRGLYRSGEDGAAGLDDATPTVQPATQESFDGDDLVAVCGYHEFSALIRGAFRPLGGVSAVASPPGSRRRGYVEDLLSGLHAELRSEGYAFAALWPFSHAFYRRLGYARVNDYLRTTVAPDELASASPPPAGEFVELSPDDWERLDAVYDAAAREPLAMDRMEDWWRVRVFQSWGTDPFVYGWERDGDLRGYLAYAVEEADDGKTLAVREHAAVDHEARGHLLRFCRNHDSQVERVRLHGRPDDLLFDELSDPSAATVERRPGPMARVVDVPAALAATADPTATGDVVLAVADESSGGNDETVRLSLDGDAPSCEPAGAAPDARTDVGSLARLAIGSHSVERLEELGELAIESDAARETLASAFPPADPAPFLREGF